MAWEGLRQALTTDPEGVRAVLETVRRIPQTESRTLQSPPLWAEVAWLIEHESRWNPAAQNPASKATGLIQWMPSTSRAVYHLEPEDLQRMTRAEQAPLVERYLKAVAGHYGPYGRVGEVYLAGAYPLARAWPNDRAIAEPGSPIWKQNPVWRDPTDGDKVTVRRVLQVGQPPAMPPDVASAVHALLPDIDTAHTIAQAPTPRQTATASSGPPPAPTSAAAKAPTDPPATQQQQPPTQQPPVNGKTPGQALAEAAASVGTALLLLYLLTRRGCP